MDHIRVLIQKNIDYFKVLFFITLVVAKKVLSIYKYDADKLDLIVFNNVTYLYVVSLVLILLFLRNRFKLLFIIFLTFYSGFYIDLKYELQPHTFLLGSTLLQKQIVTIFFLLLVGISLSYLLYRYFKYLITFFIIRYLVGIIVLLFSPGETYRYIPPGKAYKSEKNSYILLFDEYPSQYVIKTFLHHQEIFLDDFSNREKFIQLKTVRSNYDNTEMSIPSILYGKLNENFKVKDAINSLSKNRFSQKNKFVGYSIFDSINSRDAINNSNFIRSLNSLATRYFFPLLIRLVDGRGHGIFYNIDQYHQEAFKLLEDSSHYRGNKKQVVFIHFFTPHDQVFSKRKNMLDRIQEANEFMVRSLNIINKNDPEASVVIMSDHGYRGVEVPSFYKYNGLLMYRNIDLDTLTIKKNGIVSLFDKR